MRQSLFLVLMFVIRSRTLDDNILWINTIPTRHYQLVRIINVVFYYRFYYDAVRRRSRWRVVTTPTNGLLYILQGCFTSFTRCFATLHSPGWSSLFWLRCSWFASTLLRPTALKTSWCRWLGWKGTSSTIERVMDSTTSTWSKVSS